MTKEEAINIIDLHKNSIINAVDLLNWTWLRVIVNQISKDEWERYVEKATEVLRQ